MQSKALSAYKDIAFKGFKLPNEKSLVNMQARIFFRDASLILKKRKQNNNNKSKGMVNYEKM